MKLFTTTKLPCVVIAVTSEQAAMLLNNELERRKSGRRVTLTDLREINMREVGAHIWEGE